MREEFLTSSLLSAPGLIHGFSTRLGGVSGGPFASLNLGAAGDRSEAVQENLERLKLAAGAGGFRWASVDQVHGDTVLCVDHGIEAAFAGGEADALVTDQPGWLVGVRTADCVPILIAGPGVVGAVHAGWRGTAARIVVAAVRRIEAEFGVPASSLRAAIGPSIGLECYQVGREVVSGLARALEGSPEGLDGVVFEGRETRVDLREANRRLLLQAGLSLEAVDVLNVCVSCDTRFYSHRRDQGRTGRMLNFIGLQPG